MSVFSVRLRWADSTLLLEGTSGEAGGYVSMLPPSLEGRGISEMEEGYEEYSGGRGPAGYVEVCLNGEGLYPDSGNDGFRSAF